MPMARTNGISSRYYTNNTKCWRTAMALLFISVFAPLALLVRRAGSYTSAYGQADIQDWLFARGHSDGTRKLSALEQIDNGLSGNERKLYVDGGSSDALEDVLVRVKVDQNLQEQPAIHQMIEDQPGHVVVSDDILRYRSTPGDKQVMREVESTDIHNGRISVSDTMDKIQGSRQQNVARSARSAKQKLPTTGSEFSKSAVDSEAVGDSQMKKHEKSKAILDRDIKLMRQQLTMAKVYASIAQAHNDSELLQALRLQIKDIQETLGEAEIDTELPASASNKIKVMGDLLVKARDQHYDCTDMVKKLRAMVHVTEEQIRMLKKQSLFLSQLAAKTVPQGLHCLSMRLNMEYYMLPSRKRQFTQRENLEHPGLYHYALFSDNVMAASVVVNSTVFHAKEPEKHVFHLVTDKLNYGAMKLWFLVNPPGNATIQVENVDSFDWLNSSYCPVLRQLESAAVKEYYFKADQPATSSSGASGLKYRNPKYLSMLNHLRFYLPQIYPKLDKVVFLDDDIVVQKDLTPLWNIDLLGKVNGAVETCGQSFHRFDRYLNFSNQLIAKNFDPLACGWAYGMNVFDLKQWKKQDITGIYHRWQNLNEDRSLWKLGTLPPGLITFYNLTYALDKQWHVLGLGYNPAVRRRDIETAAVIHYNGNMKPWLEIAIRKFKPYWTKYVKYDHPFLQLCNIND